MKVLAIKQPWASLIADGKKTIEVRSRSTNIRERVAIYASLSPFDKRGPVIPSPVSCRGYIIATAEIVDCVEYSNVGQFATDKDKHLIPYADEIEYAFYFGWHLENVKKLEQPIPYKMPKGCVVWANAELDI